MNTNNNFRRSFAIVLVILSILAFSVPASAQGEAVAGAPVAAAESGFVPLSYRLLRGGNPVGKVAKGEMVTVELVLKSTAVKTNELDPAVPIDASRIVDSFSAGGAAMVELQSQNDEALQLKVTFPDCTYNGSGKAFKFMVGYRKNGAENAVYEQGEITAVECEEYVAPQPTPTPAPAVIPAPKLRIARSDLPTLKAGDEVVISLFFTNMGNVTMEDALASVSTSEALLLLENASSFALGSVAAGRTVTVPMRFRVAKAVPAEQQSISVEVKFNYYNGESRAQGSASDKLNLQAKTTAAADARPDGPVPNIILQKYLFGDGSGQVAAGSEFDLTLDFLNTSSKRKTENVVMTVEPGEGLSLSNSANTFYYKSLGKEEGKSETLRLLALPNAKPGAGEISLTFKYEYVDNNKRSNVTLTQKLSVQIFQPDRFDVTLNALPESLNVGEEATVSLNYMNKGRSDVANVQARLEGNVTALGSVQNIGNLEPGKSGSINFVLTPQEAGAVECKITIAYEDAGGKAKTKEIPVSLTAAETIADPAMDGEFPAYEEPQSKGGALWYILGAAGLCGGGTAAAMLLKKKNRKKTGRKAHYEWQDESEG